VATHGEKSNFREVMLQIKAAVEKRAVVIAAKAAV